MKNTARKLLILLAGSFLTAAAWAAPTLIGGTASGVAGSTVPLTISFNAGSSNVAGVSFRLTLPAGLSPASTMATMVTPGAILGAGAANKVVVSSFSPVCDNTINYPAGTLSCSTLPPANTWNFLVVGPYSPPPATGTCSGTVLCGNANLINGGTTSATLMTVMVTIAPGAPTGALSVPISNAVYVDNTNTTGVSDIVTGGTSTPGTVNVTQFSPCDVNHDNSTDLLDIIAEVLQILGKKPCTTGDILKDGCTGTDLSRIVNSALGINGGICVAP